MDPKLTDLNEISNSFKEALKDLYFWEYGSQVSSFSDRLYSLLTYADENNLNKLKIVFPAHVLAFQLWRKSPIKFEFYKKFGLSELVSKKFLK